MNRISSGNLSLDKLLGGGFPVPAAVLVVGEPTSGIGYFLRSMTWNLLKQGFDCLYFTVDQSADDTREFFRSSNWDLEPFEKEGSMIFSDLFSRGVDLIGESLENEPEKIVEKAFKTREIILTGRNFVMKAWKKGHKKLVTVLDSMTPLFAMTERREVFLFGQTLKYSTRYFKVLGITALHSGVVDKQTEDTIRHMADSVIEFSYVDAQKTQERVKVQKLAGALSESVPITVDESGIIFHLPPT